MRISEASVAGASAFECVLGAKAESQMIAHGHEQAKILSPGCPGHAHLSDVTQDAAFSLITAQVLSCMSCLTSTCIKT